MSEFEEIRCPRETCYGWISEVEGGSNSAFYGCGSCGNVWHSRSELFNAVRNVSEKYPYRALVYLEVKGGYSAVDLDDEPDDYEERVAEEWNNV